jgi:hypothetical protein
MRCERFEGWVMFVGMADGVWDGPKGYARSNAESPKRQQSLMFARRSRSTSWFRPVQTKLTIAKFKFIVCVYTFLCVVVIRIFVSIVVDG